MRGIILRRIYIVGILAALPTVLALFFQGCTSPSTFGVKAFYFESGVKGGTGLEGKVTLSASRTSIVAGQSTVLSWSSINATSCTGTGFSTGGQTSGSVTVTPNLTTLYIVSCSGDEGTFEARLMIAVVNLGIKPSTASLLANPPVINAGQSTVLSWSSTNATSCAGTGFSTGGQTSGSVTVSLSATTTYVITCSGVGDPMSASATVGVLSSQPAVDARAFSRSRHQGTLADPWPGHAIVDAINNLPDTGGTVSVADGIWLFDSPLNAGRKLNVSLVGASVNAQLVFTGAGQLAFGDPYGSSAMKGLVISSLTFDAKGDSEAWPFSALKLVNCQGCLMTGNTFLAHNKGSNIAVYVAGGGNLTVQRNSIVSYNGDSQLWIVPGANSPNSRVTVSENSFDSTNITVGGFSDVQVTKNHFGNQTLGNSISVFYCGGFNNVITGFLIDGNTLDTSNRNGVSIQGGATPASMSIVNDITISNNVITGTFASINLSGFSEGYNMIVEGNTLTSYWGGSVLNLRNGPDGFVNTVWVNGNSLIGNLQSGNTPNQILQDSNTLNAIIGVNSGL